MQNSSGNNNDGNFYDCGPRYQIPRKKSKKDKGNDCWAFVLGVTSTHAFSGAHAYTHRHLNSFVTTPIYIYVYVHLH